MAELPGMPLVEFIRYNNWSNQQVLESCRKLDEGQLSYAIPGAYGTIRETLQHIIRAEASYLQALTGTRPEPPFDWKSGPGLAEIADYAALVGDALLDAAGSLDPSRVIHQDWDGNPVHYQALALFIQIVDHGIEHRTNVTTLLNQGLGKPPDIDGWSYLRTFPDRFELE
jgi:uncharacterized damage-inducible protein DinB